MTELKSSFPDIQEQLEEPEHRRTYFVVKIRGVASTQRDLKKLLADQPLQAGESIVAGKELAVKEKVKVDYEFV